MRIFLSSSASVLAGLAALAGVPAPAAQHPLSHAEIMQNQVHEEMQQVRDRLLREEAGNFAELWVEHRPEWRVVFAFKRDPETTLRRYTSNPLFVARKVRYSMEELEAARSDAEEQLRKLGVPLGTTDADEVGNDVDIVTLLEQPEVDKLLASGRLRLHPAVNVTGPAPLPRPAVTPEAARHIRIFPQAPLRSVSGTRELGYGTIILRDGCLRLDGPGDADAVVYFAAETGLKLDEAGRLAFFNRRTGETLARVGERLALTGGAGRGRITDPKVVGPIKAACGEAEITYGGFFESLERFEGRRTER